MYMIKSLTVLALVAAIGTAVCAQDGPPPGGIDQNGPPSAGPQGPSGRMQGPPRRGIGGPMLLMLPAVQKDLKLSDDQIQKIKALMPPSPGQGGGQNGGPPDGGPANGGPPNGGPPNGGPPGGGFQNGPRGRGNGAEMDKKLQEILTADQYSRLKQIRLQVEGPRAMLRPEIAQKLGLTQDQRDQIQNVFQQDRPTPPPNDGGGQNGGPGNFRQAMEERRTKIDKAVMAILTDSQKSTWHELTGAPIKLPPMGPGGPGGRGGFGGGPGGPPPPQGSDNGQGGPPPPPPGGGGAQG